MDEPPLFLAAKADDEDRLASLLESGVGVDTKAGPFKWTALHVAAGHNSLKAIRALLYARADPSACASDLETPLHIAAQEGHEASIRLIVSRHADVAAVNADRETPLHVAVQHIGGKQSLTHLTALLALRADPSAKNDEGQDAFTCATLFTNRAAELHKILKGGAHSASSGSSKATSVRSVPEGEFSTAVLLAIKRGQVDCVRQLLQWSPNPVAAAESGIATAAAAGHVELLDLLAAAGGDIHARNLLLPLADFEEGDIRLPLLVVAAREGAASVARWLLSQRCDANVTVPEEANSALGSLDGRCGPQWAATTSSSYWTPLMAASHAGFADVARLLLDARAELEAAAPNGKTARVLAHGHSEVTKLLSMRATLSARTLRAAKPSEGSEGAAAPEDTRDLDELVRELGGGKAPKPKAAKRNKKKRAGPKSDQESHQGTTELAEASEADGEVPVAANLAPIDDNPEAVAQAEDEEQAATLVEEGAAKEELEEERPRGVADAVGAGQEKDEARCLRRRLREILAARAQLDTEELQILTRLDEMAGGGG